MKKTPYLSPHTEMLAINVERALLTTSTNEPYKEVVDYDEVFDDWEWED